MDVTKEVEPDFKSQFYNLQGTHITERKRNFYKLLNSTNSDLPKDQIDIQPRNYQENIFYVDVLIHFRQVEKLIEILKGGIGVLAGKVLKQQWLFREAFKNMSEEDIVNDFLPTLSFSIRMKVLKKLSLTLGEERMDIIFDLLLERYGLFVAKQFLFSCSSPKIIKILKNNEITLLSEQLKRILQKDIEVLKVYFEEYTKNMRRDFNDHNFLSYVAWKHPNLFFELGLNNKHNIKLGRFTTRAVIKTDREKVLNDIQNPRWNTAALVREVKTFDKEYLFRFFPDDMNCLSYYSIKSLVSKYPIKKRWEVFSQAFKQVYKKEIIEHLELFDDQLANLFPHELKQKWAEKKYIETDNLYYLKYYDPKIAFKLLKDKINVTSDIGQRGNFLNQLITFCCENKDYPTYEGVLKYICLRHRNDDSSVRANMIFHIKIHTDYNLLTKDHWKHINEIIDIQRARGESLPFEMMVEYLLFVYQNKHPLDEPVIQYIKDCIKNCRSFRLLRGSAESERNILKYIIKMLPTLQLENDRDVTFQIMSDIMGFNKHIKNDNILNQDFNSLWIDFTECPSIMDFIKEVCTRKEPHDLYDYDVVKIIILYNCIYSENPLKVVDEDGLLQLIKIMSGKEDRFSDCIFEVIKKPKRNTFENTLLDYYFSKANISCAWNKQNGIKHFLAKEPEVIAKYFSVILPLDVECSVLKYDTIKKYSHLELDKKLILHFQDLVSISSKYLKKINIIKALSRVMDTKSFLDLVKDYTPVEKKLDLKNQEQTELYQLQCDIAKVFRNLDEPSLLAPVLMHFAQGDYLQSSLPVVYRVLYRINQEQASFYLNVLGGRAVSTRKHAVFLGFELLSLKDATTLYSLLSNKETNISAKKYMLDAILKYFLKNPLESLLNIVFQNMDFVDKNDTEMIQTIVASVNKIPNRNRPSFVEKVWNLLDFLEQQEVKVFDYRNEVLRTINEQGVSFIFRLNKNFCENLIKRYFFPSNNVFLGSDVVDNFVINYLLAYLDEQHFEFVFNIIKSYKDIHWKSNNNKIEHILSFFNNAYREFDQNDVKFLNLFVKFWQQLFHQKECIFEHTLLRLMVLYKENTDIETFSGTVDKFAQVFIEEYGPYISVFFIDSIKTFYGKIRSSTDFHLANFAFHLLKANSSEFNCFAAYSIIQNFASTEKEIYLKVVDILKGVDNATVRIFCDILLKRIETY